MQFEVVQGRGGGRGVINDMTEDGVLVVEMGQGTISNEASQGVTR